MLARPALPEIEARKELLVRAARHHGVGTFEDLTDYHRQRKPPCRPLIAELVEEGRLVEATVEGWKQPAYVLPDAVVPRRISARALLSPFDSVVWNRDRTERLFGFRYRIEIYVPPPKRQYGYYVLPFLLGDELVARVDLKADRQRSTLLVQSAWGEPGINEPEVAGELLAELRLMADWLGLETRRARRPRRPQSGAASVGRRANAQRSVRVTASPAGRTATRSAIGRYGSRSGARAHLGSRATAAAPSRR